MSALQPHQVISRANSGLLAVDLVSNDVHLPPDQRMALITQICEDYRCAVMGSTTDPFRRAPTYPEYLARRVRGAGKPNPSVGTTPGPERPPSSAAARCSPRCLSTSRPRSAQTLTRI